MNTISNLIQLEDLSKENKQHLIKKLTFSNPEWESKQKMGLWIGNTPQHIKMYEDNDGILKMPFGMLGECLRLGIDFDTNDFANVPIDAISSIKLRNYQFHAVNQMIKRKNGILSMFAGSGKTETAIHAVVELKQKTLWLTHTQDLVLQAQQRAESKTTLITSLITEGKMDLSGDIVFCTVQTLSKMLDKIDQKAFGCLIVDECHRLSNMGMFQKCVEYFHIRYKFGITATQHRADGLFNIVKAVLGDTIYDMQRDDKQGVFHCIGFDLTKGVLLCDVPITEFQVPARVITYDTDYTIDNDDLYDAKTGTIIYSKMISDLAMSSNRNVMILDLLKCLDDKHTLILSDRLDQLNYLHENTCNSILIDGKTKKKDRERMMQEMRDGKHACMFATWKLAKEGIDIPIIDNIVFGTPNKDYAVIVQAVGRGQRPYKDKKVCIVHDIVDAKCGILYANKKKRFAVYKKNGIEVLS